jgi:hypothetical protein
LKAREGSKRVLANVQGTREREQVDPIVSGFHEGAVVCAFLLGVALSDVENSERVTTCA